MISDTQFMSSRLSPEGSRLGRHLLSSCVAREEIVHSPQKVEDEVDQNFAERDRSHVGQTSANDYVRLPTIAKPGTLQLITSRTSVSSVQLPESPPCCTHHRSPDVTACLH